MHRAPAFPPLHEIETLGATEYERGFLRTEFEPGLDYYLNRLDRVGFRGGRLLDAGCGAGQWSLAAAQRFTHVDAIDVNAPRLDVLRQLASRMEVSNITIREGVIESLPYDSSSFDAVWCYGVIMFTDVAASLREFSRVLKPGGRLYVCLNADGWSRYLIRERGVSDRKAADAGRQTLYNAHWRRAVAAGIVSQLRRPVAGAEQRVPRAVRRLAVAAATATHAVVPGLSASAGRALLLAHEAGVALVSAIEADCGHELARLMDEDAIRIAGGASRWTRTLKSDAFLPGEFRDLTVAAGFTDFSWQVESGLMCDWTAPSPAPRYPARDPHDLGVWEALVAKPDHGSLPVDLERHYRLARDARDTPVFVEPAAQTVLNSGSMSYPPGLLAYAQDRAAAAGGGRYLDALLERVLAGSTSDDDRVRRIITFVQRAVYRDPVSQPVNADGSLPDAPTLLFCARGRCSHTSAVLVDLFRRAGFDARIRPLGRHVIAEVQVDGRWAIADADAFKNGVIPVNARGQLLTLAEVQGDPYVIDRFQPTGWWIREDSRFTRGATGGRVSGYVDALDPDRRGFVSGYYVPDAQGFPPSLPRITRFEMTGSGVELEWTASTAAASRYVAYRVAIGTTSRGWSYDDPGSGDEILRSTGDDVSSIETRERRLAVPMNRTVDRLFASVTAISDRVERAPRTFFWPSEEAVWSQARSRW